MPISNLVESAVSLAENVTGADIDRDGDIGVRGTSAEKQRDEEVTTKSIQEKSTGGLPDISGETPKVSLFKYTSMGQELITACSDQAEEFADIARQKVGFMKINQEKKDSSVKFTTCVIRNAAAVRLCLVGPNGEPGYRMPYVIEPGQCVSFLAPGESGEFTYEIQVFEGPFATPVGGGWNAPTVAKVGFAIPNLTCTYANKAVSSVNPAAAFKAKVQVANPGELVDCSLKWTYRFGTTPDVELQLTQKLD